MVVVGVLVNVLATPQHRVSYIERPICQRSYDVGYLYEFDPTNGTQYSRNIRRSSLASVVRVRASINRIRAFCAFRLSAGMSPSAS